MLHCAQLVIQVTTKCIVAFAKLGLPVIGSYFSHAHDSVSAAAPAGSAMSSTFSLAPPIAYSLSWTTFRVNLHRSVSIGAIVVHLQNDGL